MTDQNTNIQQLKDKVSKFVRERNWRKNGTWYYKNPIR